MGNLIQFFPRHVLVACIGGIGIFLFITGIEICARLEPKLSFEFLIAIFQPPMLKLWGTSFAAAIILKILQLYNRSPLLVPFFYAIVPIIFYTIIYITGRSLDQLRQDGWLFNLPSASDAPFYIFWTFFDFKVVNWTAICSTIPTQLALTFFGILHVPINVPALSISTGQDFDLSKELIGHGLGNLISGFTGGLQNYMVYSNSLIFIRSGGGSFASCVMLCFASVIVWIKGSEIVGFVPVVLVGALIFHLAVDLIKESLFDTLMAGLHPLEYITIISIVAVMGFIGFTEGIVVGVVLTCIFFVVIYAQRSVIRDSFKGSQLRSTVHRLYRQRIFLDNVGDQIHILKLQGFMFFGTISQLSSNLDEVILIMPQTRFVILDFSLVNGVDYSGLESFSKIRRTLSNHRIYLILCSTEAVNVELKRCGLLDTDIEDTEPCVYTFSTLNESLEWCENTLLSCYYVKSDPIQPQKGKP